MLKKLSQLTVVGFLLGGLIVFPGCQGEDISAPEQELDASGNPVGTTDMIDEDAEDTDEGGSTEEGGEAK